jgi:hypothetical protein
LGYQGRGKFAEAAAALIRMTGEDADLRSALLLVSFSLKNNWGVFLPKRNLLFLLKQEQAAACFSDARPPQHRRAAFHQALAGHRFSKAQQYTHALQSYLAARRLYRPLFFSYNVFMAE